MEGIELTQREFANERGVSFSNLRNWLYKLRKETRPLATEAARQCPRVWTWDGRRAEALASLQAALDLKPQSTQLKDLTRELEPAIGEADGRLGPGAAQR